MRGRPHPETGVSRRRALDTLFELLIVTVLLGAVLNALVNHLGIVPEVDRLWWIWLAVFLTAIPVLLYLGIRWDDERQWDDTRIGLLLPYEVFEDSGRVELGRRRSYPVTNDALAAWNARHARHGQAGYVLRGRGSFAHRLMGEHMALVHHLLIMHLARFGRRCDPRAAVHSWLRLLDLPLGHVAWEELPPLVQRNVFSQAIGPARPESLCLPKGTRLEVFDKGPIMLRLRWGPAPRWPRRQMVGLGPLLPGGEVRVRWLGPLSEVGVGEKRYDHLTARLQSPGAEARVVATRLLVEVRTRWNVLRSVERFRDWAINLADYLAAQMDYETWRRYYLERSIDDLDWKIGWIAKDEEPGLAGRLRRIDQRLARLEEHLWPDEPAEGGTDGAWLSGRGEVDGIER